MLKICYSLSNCKDTQEKYFSFRVEVLKRCGSYMRVLLYTIKRSSAKLIIKHRMYCNKPINYKGLTKLFLDIIAWLYEEGGNSHILEYRMCHFRALSFGWKINFWVYFVACNQICWSDSHGTLSCILFSKYGKVYWC